MFLCFFSPGCFGCWGFIGSSADFSYRKVFFLKRHIGVVHSFPSNTCHTQSKSKKKKLEKTKKTEEKKNMRNGGPHSAAFCFSNVFFVFCLMACLLFGEGKVAFLKHVRLHIFLPHFIAGVLSDI